MSREAELILAHLALEQGHVLPEQLDRCLKKAAGDPARRKDLAVCGLLVSGGLLTFDQVDSLEDLRRSSGRERLIDGYEIESIVGKGGMGCVYRARQLSMDRPVALKTLPVSWSADGDWIARFLREARATARLTSPHVVQGYDVGTSHGIHYFAMEFVEGQDLRRILDERGLLPEAEAVRIALHVARGLEAACEAGLVHRDVKPDNILVHPKGIAKLADLGLAKGREPAGTELTQAGAVIGTPRYVSPEQASGEPLDSRSDIYSLGITLFQMLTGQLPFLHDSPVVLLARRCTEDVPPVRSLRPDLSPEIEHIIARMTRRPRGERYQDPSELANDLESHLARGPRAHAPAPPPPARTDARPSSSPALPRTRPATRFLFFHVPTEEETFFAVIAGHGDLVGRADLQTALELQECQAEVGVHLPLDRILVDKGWLSAKHRDRIREVQSTHRISEMDTLFGKIAVQLGLTTEERIEEGRRAQKASGTAEPPRLGDLLVERGWLTQEGKGRILAEQVRARRTEETRRFGTIALKCGFVDKARLDRALRIQGQRIKDRQPHTKLGEILIELGYLTDGESRAILRAQRRNEITGKPIRELVQEVLADPISLDYDSQADGVTRIE